jgi:hypothetical protein
LVDGALLCHQFGRRSRLLGPQRRKSEVVPVHSVTRIEVKRDIDRPTRARLTLHVAADDGEGLRVYTDCGPRIAVDRLVRRIRSQRKEIENRSPARKANGTRRAP